MHTAVGHFTLVGGTAVPRDGPRAGGMKGASNTLRGQSETGGQEGSRRCGDEREGNYFEGNHFTELSGAAEFLVFISECDPMSHTALSPDPF